MGMHSQFSRMVSKLRSWGRAVTQRKRLELEMDAELSQHLERLTVDLIRTGYSPAEASRRARIELGPTLVHKEEMRAELGLRWWDALGADVRSGIYFGGCFIAVAGHWSKYDDLFCSQAGAV